MGHKKTVKQSRRAIIELLRELREYERAGDWQQVANNAHSIINWAWDIENAADNLALKDSD